MEVRRFVRLEWGPQLVGLKHYPKGSVVEVSETRAKAMVQAKAAAFDPGPASEPTPEPAADPKKKAEAK